MSGRPVRLLTAATVAAAASLLSISTASASCYSGCGGGYAAPVAYYTAPVVYSYSYAAPVSYAAPCANPCGYSSYGYASPRPMYVVNQGPAYNEPVFGEAEGVYDTGYRRAYPYMGDGGVRWHRRHWHRGYGYRGHRQSFGYRHGYGIRHGYRHHGFRHGYRDHGFRHGSRYSMRHPMVGYGSRYSMRHPMVGHGGRYSMRHPMVGHGGMHRMHGPRMGMHGPRHMQMPRMHMNRMPGAVHPRHMGPPMGGPKKKWP